jgi:hypothetical protein
MLQEYVSIVLGVLEVFHIDVVKIYRDFTYLAMVVHQGRLYNLKGPWTSKKIRAC